MILDFIFNVLFATICFIVFGTLLTFISRLVYRAIKKGLKSIARGLKIPLDKLFKPW